MIMSTQSFSCLTCQLFSYLIITILKAFSLLRLFFLKSKQKKLWKCPQIKPCFHPINTSTQLLPQGMKSWNQLTHISLYQHTVSTQQWDIWINKHGHRWVCALGKMNPTKLESRKEGDRAKDYSIFQLHTLCDWINTPNINIQYTISGKSHIP